MKCEIADGYGTAASFRRLAAVISTEELAVCYGDVTWASALVNIRGCQASPVV